MVSDACELWSNSTLIPCLKKRAHIIKKKPILDFGETKVYSTQTSEPQRLRNVLTVQTQFLG